MAANQSKRTGSKGQGQDCHSIPPISNGRYPMAAETDTHPEQLEDDATRASRDSQTDNRNAKTAVVTHRTATAKKSPQQSRPRRLEPKVPKPSSQPRDMTDSSDDKSEACACPSKQQPTVEPCTDLPVKCSWQNKDEGFEALAREDDIFSIQLMPKKASIGFDTSDDVISEPVGPLNRYEIGDTLKVNTPTTEGLDQTSIQTSCFQCSHEHETNSGQGSRVLLLSEQGEATREHSPEQTQESNGYLQHDNNRPSLQARHHDLNKQELLPPLASTIRTNDSQVQGHPHCRLDSHWPRQNGNTDSAPLFSRNEPMSLNQDSRGTSRLDTENGQSRMAKRKLVSDPSEATGEKDRMSVTFDDVITSLDLLLLRTTPQSGGMPGLTKVIGL